MPAALFIVVVTTFMYSDKMTMTIYQPTDTDSTSPILLPEPTQPAANTDKNTGQKTGHNSVATNSDIKRVGPPYITIYPLDGSAGRLGNFFFRYASALGMAKANNMTLILPDTPLVRKMRESFSLSAPLESELATPVDWTIHQNISESNWGVFDSKLFLLPHVNTRLNWVYSQSWKYFYPIDDQVRQEFVQKPSEVTTNSKQFMEKMRDEFSNKTSGIVIGMHVRRGDFLIEHHQKWGYAVATKEYFSNATKYFVDKFGKDILFIVASDDKYWCQQTIDFNGAYARFSTDKSALEDMTILGLCDHHVISVGSFGWWTAWLSKGQGEVIYYKNFPTPGSNHAKNHNPVDYFLPNWRAME